MKFEAMCGMWTQAVKLLSTADFRHLRPPLLPSLTLVALHLRDAQGPGLVCVSPSRPEVVQRTCPPELRTHIRLGQVCVA
jgi:hypothetical protein